MSSPFKQPDSKQVEINPDGEIKEDEIQIKRKAKKSPKVSKEEKLKDDAIASLTKAN